LQRVWPLAFQLARVAEAHARAIPRSHSAVRLATRKCYKVLQRIVTIGVSGGRSLTRAVTRRPPLSLDTMVPRTAGYAYDATVWDLSIVQGPFSVAPCQTLT
jgi:hypothetical protein